MFILNIFRKKKFLLCSLVFIIILSSNLTFSSCYSSTSDTEILYSTAIKKTVEIRCYNTKDKIGYATGCVVANEGKILTNKHVIMSNDNFFQHIEIRFFNDDAFIPATILKVSETDDLALLKIDHETEDAFTIGRNVKGGEHIFILGNPNGFGLSFSEGTVSAPLRYVKYKEKDIKTTQISIVINEGNSGGPLFNTNGELIGLITFRLHNHSGEIIQGVSFALHHSIIKQFLE